MKVYHKYPCHYSYPRNILHLKIVLLTAINRHSLSLLFLCQHNNRDLQQLQAQSLLLASPLMRELITANIFCLKSKISVGMILKSQRTSYGHSIFPMNTTTSYLDESEN